MRRYETVFILRTDLGDEQLKESIRRFAGIIATGGGDLIETDEWGSRELAYKIEGERRGYYVRLDYTGSGAAMNELERNLRLADNVLRYLSVMVAEQADAATLREEIEARKRHAAERNAAAATAAEAQAAAPAQPAAAVQAPADPADDELDNNPLVDEPGDEGDGGAQA